VVDLQENGGELGEVVEFDLSGLSGESIVGIGHAIGTAGTLAIGCGLVDVDERLRHLDNRGMELDGGIYWRGFDCLANDVGDAGFVLTDVLFARMREESWDIGDLWHGMIWLGVESERDGRRIREEEWFVVGIELAGSFAAFFGEEPDFDGVLDLPDIHEAFSEESAEAGGDLLGMDWRR
jgi:hypothetical protein